MQTFNVDVKTPDGAMDCFIAHPDGDGPFHPVMLYMDVPGIREELRDFARRLAGDGLMGVLPDLYYREGKVRFDFSKGESELQKMFTLGSQLTNAMIMRDTQGILDYLAGQENAHSDTGTLGYCMSGQFVISAGGTFPDRIRATASLYGTQIVTDKDDSPHRLIPQMRGELYLGFAEHDPYVEDFVVPEMTALLDANEALTYTLETHPGTEHGFCFPQRPAYNADAAEDVWQKMLEMYRRALH
ncbi:MAG: dienelactone hydrolase family protein [Pseudomonadales bacterium]|jgi:carboxymethylenebutenolidase|nr:dienelactone hydrolase family protein [Pseudomonadales bacterium]|tara:strand:+ start:201 stop:929 length:729 start_codon:yes stop_codon:yes gene_type:complete